MRGRAMFTQIITFNNFKSAVDVYLRDSRQLSSATGGSETIGFIAVLKKLLSLA